MKPTALLDRSIDKFIKPILLERKYRPTLKKNLVLRDSQKAKRCFILATGPSIQQQDLIRLKDEHTFMLNTFWQHPDYVRINPKYYVVVDTYNFPTTDNRGSAWVQDLIDRNKVVSTCNTKLFFNIAGEKFIAEQKLFSQNEIYYLAFNRFFTDDLKFNIEIDKVLPNVKNVVIACIMTAAYMGFEKIYLLGCEHDFLAHPSQLHYQGFQHFYKTNYSAESKEDVQQYALDVMSYERHIDHTKILFKNYRLLKEKLMREKPNVKIFNATPGSFLDVFPFVQYEAIAL